MAEAADVLRAAAATIPGCDPDRVAALSGQERHRALEIIAELRRRASMRKIETFYPDDGPLRRELYPKHMEFFAAGKFYRERAAIASNRAGKTEGLGAFEMACHLTGIYPHWWPGRTWDRPVRAWAAGKTNETTRDIVQAKLFGPILGAGSTSKRFAGTGMVYGHCLGDVTWKQGVQNFADTVKVKHASGGWSQLGLKSYQQGRGSFEGTEQDIIWCDEEPDGADGMGIYNECQIRTMTTDGMLMLTFTPLEGITQVVLQFLPGSNPEAQAQEAAQSLRDLTGEVSYA